MKKRNVLIFLLATVFISSLSLFVGCSSSEKLKTPTGVWIDEENVLRWSEVGLARGYAVSVTGSNGVVNETSTENEYFSLDGLDEGKYYVKVKAVGNKRDKKDSDWSETLDFAKGRTTGLVYKLVDNDSAYMITSVGRAKGDVTIEDYYRNGKPVIAIGERAFKDCRDITSLTLGENISVVYPDAFYGCVSLGKITLPKGLSYLGDSAFQGCSSLKEITLPAGLSSVADYTFAYCHSLETINFDVEETTLLGGETQLRGVTKIGKSAFLDCREVKTLTLPETLTGVAGGAFAQMTGLTRVEINDGLDYINSESFSGDSALKEIVFGDDSLLTFIGDAAFANCTALETFAVPGNVTELGSSVFYGCSALENVTISPSVEIIGKTAFNGTKIYEEQPGLTDSQKTEGFKYVDGWIVDYTGDKNNLQYFNERYPTYKPEGGIVGIAERTFANSGLIEVTIPASMRFLSPNAFAGCKNLKSLTFEDTSSDPSSLEKIGSNCFNYSGLATVKLPRALKEIGSYAFYGSADLESVTIPDSVDRIGTRAFRNTGLWNLAGYESSDGVVRIGRWIVDYNALENDEGNATKQINVVLLAYSGGEAVGDGKFYSTCIADYAFYNLKELTSVSNTSVLKKIGTGAFRGCSSLQSFQIPDMYFTEIKPYTFYGCTSLESVSFPNPGYMTDIETIGAYAFYDCEKLSFAFGLVDGQLDLSYLKTETISPFAFAYCYSLKSVRFSNYSNPGTITGIGAYAFYGCNGLETLSLTDKIEAIGSHAFFECDGLTSVDFGTGLKYIYDAAFYGCDGLSAVTFPSSTIYVGSKAFYKCYGIYSVEFLTETDGETVRGVQYVDNYAFYDDEKLSIIELPSSLKYVGKYAFKGMVGAGSVTISSNVSSVGAHVFYGADATVYLEDGTNLSDWSGKWNSGISPVVNGCVLENGYVASLTIKSDTFVNANDVRRPSAPRRDGYTFLGWALTPGGEVEYTQMRLTEVPVGTTLYAVWQEATEWKVVLNSDGKVDYIVVGSGEVPTGFLKDYVDGKTDSSDSATDTAKDGIFLVGWSFVRNGTPIFLVERDYSIEKLSLVAPGTVLYAVNLDWMGLKNALNEYDVRHAQKSELVTG